MKKSAAMGINGRKGRMAAVLAFCLQALGCHALPQPIQNGVLTGPLNANGQAITNTGSVTFSDGTTLSTASGAGGGGGGGGIQPYSAPYLTGTHFSGLQVGGFAGAFWMGSTLANNIVSENSGGLIASTGIRTSNNVDLYVGGKYYGDGSGLTGLSSNNFSGHIPSSYVDAPTGGTLITSVSSNTFTGQLNVGQVYGLGTAVGLSSNQIVNMATNSLAAGAYLTPGNIATLSSNTVIGMAGAAIRGSNYLTSASSNTFTGSLNAGQIYGLGNVVSLSSNQVISMAIANVAGGSATNAIGLNGGTGTNINLRQTTSVDVVPQLYATPTRGLFYGDSITQGNYVTNGYCADLAAMGFHNFTVYDWGISSSHITDVSNLFYGSLYSGSRAYTNYPTPPGTNFFVSFWVGINDCLYDNYPEDTNTWIQNYTNMWWLAHNQGASQIYVFTIEDSTLLSSSREITRANLNSLITQNALADAPWVTLLNNDLILPSTNAVYFLYNPTANYGLHPNDYGHLQVAKAFASQMLLATNLAGGAYFNGPVWSAQGFGGSGSNLINVPMSLGGPINGANTASAVGMLGIDASGHVTSNAVPTSGSSTSSNNFVGSLNVGQVYGLGNGATLSSNQIVGMAASAAAANSDVLGAAQNATNHLASGAFTVVGSASTLSSNQVVNMATNPLSSGAFTSVGSAALLSSNQILGMVAATGGAATNLALNVPVTGNNSANAVWMIGVDASGRTTTNAVPVSGSSTSSNNFVGNLNVGQIYGLGNYFTNNESAQFNINNMLTIGAAQLGSGETWFDVSGAAQLGGGSVMVSSAGTVRAPNFVATSGTFTGNGANLTFTPGSIVTSGNGNVSVTSATNGTTGQITYAVAASGGGGGGGGVGVGSAVTNVALTGLTGADQRIVPYATPTFGVFYGDSITKNPYNANTYVGYLTNYSWPHFTAINGAASSSHLVDVSNAFYGPVTPIVAFTNWVGKTGTNAWPSFWIGVNDCNTSPLDTNTWIASFTNMWWAAHTNGAIQVVVFTIADELTLTPTGETNRAILNTMITQNAQADAPWLTLINNDLILLSTNTTYFRYDATAGYGVTPTDYGQSLEAQALSSQLMNGTNVPAGAYFAGPVWAAGGLGGSGSNLFGLPATKLTGVIPTTNVPVNTIVAAGSGLTVASNSVNGVQTYTVAAGTVAVTPAWLTQRVWSYGPNGSGTTLYTLGMSGSTSGTLASQAETATDPYCINLSTTSTAGNYSSIGDNQKTLNMAKATTLCWRVGLTNTANIRVWMALSDAATLATGDTSRQCVGFLYSSTNSSTDWQFCTQNGTSHTWTDTGIAADLNSHTFTTTWDGVANAYGYIDGNCVATNSTSLPTSYQWGQWLEVTALANATVGVRFVQFYGQQSF